MESNCFGKKIFVRAKYFTCHSNPVRFKQWMSKTITTIFSSQILEHLLGHCIWSCWLLMLTSISPIKAAMGTTSVSYKYQSSAQYINRLFQLHSNAFIYFNHFIVFVFTIFLFFFSLFLSPASLLPAAHALCFSWNFYQNPWKMGGFNRSKIW